MDQNALCQSDCSIFKWMKSPKQINKIAWFFACWYQFKNIKFWSTVFLIGVAKNACGQSGYELSISQEWTVEINWFFAWYYKFRKAKSCFNDFRWACLLDHDILKSSVFKIEFMNWDDFLHADAIIVMQIFLLDWYPNLYLWLLNAGVHFSWTCFSLSSLWHLILLLFWIKSEPV